MTLEVFYDTIGSDFTRALMRMGNSRKMLAKFVKKFLNDKTAGELFSAFENKDYEAAFRAAHTLKGLCANLGLDKLQKSSSELTEALRNTVADNAPELLEQVRDDYELIVGALIQLDE